MAPVVLPTGEVVATTPHPYEAPGEFVRRMRNAYGLAPLRNPRQPLGLGGLPQQSLAQQLGELLPQLAELLGPPQATLPSLKPALRAGFGIRRQAWEPGRYLTLGPPQRPQLPYRTSLDLPAPHGPGEWLQLHGRSGARSYYTPDQADALAEDWEIMTESPT